MSRSLLAKVITVHRNSCLLIKIEKNRSSSLKNATLTRECFQVSSLYLYSCNFPCLTKKNGNKSLVKFYVDAKEERMQDTRTYERRLVREQTFKRIIPRRDKDANLRGMFIPESFPPSLKEEKSTWDQSDWRDFSNGYICFSFRAHEHLVQGRDLRERRDFEFPREDKKNIINREVSNMTRELGKKQSTPPFVLHFWQNLLIHQQGSNKQNMQ